ncbi:MAG: hypothetical protein Q8O10_00610, partial [candidate division Zixibacteria bacterium]|nr:hypothetical protein [candidate division Zixibacteria bacterium]
MKKKSLILWFLSILFVELFVICLWSNAQFQQMTYQGVLTDASGKRISGTKTLTFEIYNAETIGTRLWGPETRSYTFTDSGLVNVILGSITPLNLDETQQYWLQIRVESDTLRPRIKLTAVPYSMNSDRLDGFHASSTPTAGYLYPLDGSAKIPNARLYTGSGNGLDADLLDGQHASAFLSIANDYGRSGVAPDLYEGTSTLSSKYVNEGQANSVTTSMIVNGTIQTEDLSPGISIPNAVNSDMVDNIHANTIPEANKLFPLNSQGVFYLEKNTSSNIASAVNTGSGGALWAVSNTGTAINVAGGQSAISAESDNYHTIVAKSNNSSYYSIYGYKNLGGTVIYARANV